jgi:asparagine synthetase B (glutamine-hydrolysing)
MIDHECHAVVGSDHAVHAQCSPQLLVANPAATIVSEGARLAVGHGLDREGKSRMREALTRPELSGTLGEIVAAQEEATIVAADGMAAGGPRVEVWRGATSNFEAYLIDNGPARPPAVADHFRDALAAVPPTRRTLDAKATADHLLFANVPCARTYVTEIGRLGHGEYFRWQTDRVERRLFDTLVAEPEPDQRPLALVDAALRRALSRLPIAESLANQLSGGIDSSLVQTYLPAGTPSVSGAIDIPGFAEERNYAERTSKLLGTSHHAIMASERDYLKILVDATRLCGLPIRRPLSAVLNLSFRFPAASFVNGQYGDSLFGRKPGIYYAVAFGQRRWLRFAEMLGLARLLPRGKAMGLHRRLQRLREIEAPVSGWEGLGASYGIYTNLALAELILGTKIVRERIEARAAYVAERFRSNETDTNPLFAHIEFGQLLNFHCNESFSQWRQLAHAQSKSLYTPFGCRSVVSAALAVPRSRRYIANGRTKYLLKDLLKRRVPAFEVDVPKAGNDLSIQCYFGSGLDRVELEVADKETAAKVGASASSSATEVGRPLGDAFERYAMPDIVDRKTAAATRAAPDWLTWNLLTLAIWRDEVLHDSALAPASTTRVLSPMLSSVR